MELKTFNNDIDTLERAVKERVFFVKDKDGKFVEPPKPAPGLFRSRMQRVEQLLSRHLPSATPLSHSQFVDTFRGRKRKVYEEAAESLKSLSVTPRDANVKVFVKYEKTDYTRKSDPVPRVISPRSPRYNVEVGKFLRPIEEPLFHSLSMLFEGKRTVFKGMNAAESGRAMYDLWSSFKRPVAVGLDASRFDQHVSKCALQWEHSIYPKCFVASDRPELARLLKWQIKNKCVGYCADGRIKYTKNGTRMSGDMNTSLGNCILMCSMIKQYSLDRGVRTLLANNGDDCVVFMEADDLARFSEGLDEWFRSMGFNMVVEPPCFQFEEIEFCQTHPVYTGPNCDDYLMVRHPKWAIAKDTMCIHGFPSEKIYKGWLNAVGAGGLSMTGGVPVFQDFYQSLKDSGAEHYVPFHEQSWGVRRLGLGMKRGYSQIAPETRASFYWAFGVLPDEQIVLEDFYRGWKLDYKPREVCNFQPTMPL